MRLICPKCDAQYDIADDVIPEGGRDVQCSSCAHTWFQMDKPKIAGRPLTQRPTPRPTPAEPDDGPRHKPIDATERKPLDSSIADILREEAAREQEVRATEEARPHPSEDRSQSPGERAEETRKRIAAMTGDAAATPAAVAAAATGAVQGANLRTVPGIDEINATLRARAEASDMSGLTEEEKEEVVHRRGFRRGFFIVLFLLAILIAPYFFADQIVENLPQTQEIMTQYVQIVDEGRVWLNEQVQTIRTMVEDLIAGSDTPADAPADTDAATTGN